MNKKNCTEECVGTITKVKSMGVDCPTIITVVYEVLDTQYIIQESLKLKSEAIKIGFLPIGQRKIPVIGEIEIGKKVKVLYDPENPRKAYLPENKGFVSC